ncbi:facilitated trehalose transporter Tret1-like [Aphidius gifuensis]|uniref:facilitated trehalose transporter Tret1-like n=1 Tax=Aphidius gifuensis TaxID=684658 RepID=UPI001CDD1176|nr:facilitated trehalose transporter Tret1-like [Aphidius gifuensis]
MTVNRESNILQYFATVAACLSAFTSSAMIAWTSPTLQKLEKNNPVADDNPFGHAITADESSWISSLPILATVLGCFFFGYLAKRWGRRKSLLSCVIPFSISWIFVGLAKSITTLCIGRIIGGFAIGAPLSVIPMYTAEISDKSIRGTLSSFMQVFLNIGWIFSFSIGPYVSYDILWMSCATLPFLFFITFYLMPESPYYLASQGEHEKMIQVLIKFRGNIGNDLVKAEADEIKVSIDCVQAAARLETSIMDLFRIPSNFRALWYSCIMFTFQNFSGAIVVLNNAESIFTATGVSNTVSPAVSVIIIGVVQLVFCCITPLFVDNWGRKMLLILSGIGETLSLAALGLYFYLSENANNGDGDVSGISWLPITSMIFFFATFSIGWGPLPWTVMSEIFASDIKTKAFGIIITVNGLVAFLILKFFPTIVVYFGMHSVFWLFAIICFIGILFTIFVLPETKGKSLKEIQKQLGSHDV